MCPLTLVTVLRWQKLTAQQVLLFSTGSHDVPQANITEADRIWRAMGMKVSRGGCK
jgi:hypothetical protein